MNTKQFIRILLIIGSMLMFVSNMKLHNITGVLASLCFFYGNVLSYHYNNKKEIK